MNIESLTIKEIKEISSLLKNDENKDIASHYIGKYCIFRTYSSGVFFGILKYRNGQEAVVGSCRRIWSWEGAFTLSKVSVDGVKTAKMSVAEPEKLLVQVIEITPASDTCINQLKNMDSHND